MLVQLSSVPVGFDLIVTEMRADRMRREQHGLRYPEHARLEGGTRRDEGHRPRDAADRLEAAERVQFATALYGRCRPDRRCDLQPPPPPDRKYQRETGQPDRKQTERKRSGDAMRDRWQCRCGEAEILS